MTTVLQIEALTDMLDVCQDEAEQRGVNDDQYQFSAATAKANGEPAIEQVKAMIGLIEALAAETTYTDDWRDCDSGVCDDAEQYYAYMQSGTSHQRYHALCALIERARALIGTTPETAPEPDMPARFTAREMCALDVARVCYGATFADGDWRGALATVERDVYKYTSCGASVWFHTNEAAVTLSGHVEGIDFECPKHILRMPISREAWFATLGMVEGEAELIWNATHGCGQCPENLENGYRSIDPDCPACQGEGAVI